MLTTTRLVLIIIIIGCSLLSLTCFFFYEHKLSEKKHYTNIFKIYFNTCENQYIYIYIYIYIRRNVFVTIV